MGVARSGLPGDFLAPAPPGEPSLAWCWCWPQTPRQLGPQEAWGGGGGPRESDPPPPPPSPLPSRAGTKGLGFPGRQRLSSRAAGSRWREVTAKIPSVHLAREGPRGVGPAWAPQLGPPTPKTWDPVLPSKPIPRGQSRGLAWRRDSGGTALTGRGQKLAGDCWPLGAGRGGLLHPTLLGAALGGAGHTGQFRRLHGGGGLT